MGSYVNEQMRDLLSKRRPSNITIDWEAIKKLDSGIGSTIQCYQFLYGLVTMLQPKRIIEIGMNTGVSTIVMAQALRGLNTFADHNIITIDPDHNTAHKAFEQLDQLGLKKYVESYLLPSEKEYQKLSISSGLFN
jgi:predicted O-methyltransferase YrrM